MAKTPSNRRLTLLYLANEILQTCRKAPEFNAEFKSVLPAVYDGLRSVEENVKVQCVRLLKVWEDRKVFPADFLKKIEKSVGEVQTLPYVKRKRSSDDLSKLPPVVCTC